MSQATTDRLHLVSTLAQRLSAERRRKSTMIIGMKTTFTPASPLDMTLTITTIMLTITHMKPATTTTGLVRSLSGSLSLSPNTTTHEELSIARAATTQQPKSLTCSSVRMRKRWANIRTSFAGRYTVCVLCLKVPFERS